MAKRKRLTPAQPGHFGAGGAPAGPDRGGLPHPAPVAQVAGDSAAHAALDELSDAFHAARSEGRLIDALAITAIDESYLMRDRLVQNAEDMAALMESLAARGQQTPIEVIALPVPRGGHTHGLISGWRRLTALRRLYEREKDEKFTTVKAVVIAPDTAQAAYVAMVEENEIRADLSLYERACIALRAAQEGVYPTARHAVLGLYGATPRAKRSKIGRFIFVVEALNDDLRFPWAIPEKLGLGLARKLGDDTGFAPLLRARLRNDPPQTSAEELRLLTAALSGKPGTLPAPVRPRVRAPGPDRAPGERVTERPAAGIDLSYTRDRNRIELAGPGVTEALHDALRAWLASRK